MNRTTFETALDAGNLWIAMRNGRFWRARRNGRTQLWKRSPERFSIPFKVGLKEAGRIDETWSPDFYVISESDPNVK